jgi:hypothetical protein
MARWLYGSLEPRQLCAWITREESWRGGDAATTATNVLGNSGLLRIGVVADLLQATVFVFLAMTPLPGAEGRA